MYEGIGHVITPGSISDAIVDYLVLGLVFVFEGVAWGCGDQGVHLAPPDSVASTARGPGRAMPGSDDARTRGTGSPICAE